MRNSLPPIVMLCLCIAGCAGTQRADINDNASGYIMAPEEGLVGRNAPLSARLRHYYQNWAGAPYRYGGTSRRGIDCSAFVRQATAATRGISLPRTTRAQTRRGQRIPADQLKIGDLVFFRIGRDRHVGIYVGGSRFMHASTSAGVTLSSLDSPYWRRHFWQARRLH